MVQDISSTHTQTSDSDLHPYSCSLIKCDIASVDELGIVMALEMYTVNSKVMFINNKLTVNFT